MTAWTQEVARLDESALVNEQVEASATIMDIDEEMRFVTLRNEEGDEFTVYVAEDVTRFDQLQVGDDINVTYYQALLAEMTDAPASEEIALIETAKAPVGDESGGAVGLMTTAIVTIDDVDTENHVVTFTGPSGEPREITVERPEMQQFIAGLSDGDRVRVTYGEALAISLTPAEE